MAKGTIASATGIATAHRKRARHGENGDAVPRQRIEAMQAAAEKATASGASPEKIREAILAARKAHRRS